MQDILIKILNISYDGVGIANLIAYWPTIKDLFRKNQAQMFLLIFMDSNEWDYFFLQFIYFKRFTFSSSIEHKSCLLCINIIFKFGNK